MRCRKYLREKFVLPNTRLVTVMNIGPHARIETISVVSQKILRLLNTKNAENEENS